MKSKWKVKLADGQIVGVEMTRRSASGAKTLAQLKKIISENSWEINSPDAIKPKVVDWDWCDSLEEWNQIENKVEAE